jgi:membrane-bound ClpP family serine protease
MNWIKRFYIKSKELSSSKKKQRQLCWLITLILAIFLVYDFVFFKPTNQFVIASVSIIFLLSGIAKFYPKLMHYPLLIWMLFGQILGEITSTIILGLVYFVLFFPITLFIRIFRKKKEETGWLKKSDELSDYEKMY